MHIFRVRYINNSTQTEHTLDFTAPTNVHAIALARNHIGADRLRGPYPECIIQGTAIVPSYPCLGCNTPITWGELCAECAKGNDPFLTYKYRGDYYP